MSGCQRLSCFCSITVRPTSFYEGQGHTLVPLHGHSKDHCVQLHPQTENDRQYGKGVTLDILSSQIRVFESEKVPVKAKLSTAEMYKCPLC